jgi:hypothetical protein
VKLLLSHRDPFWNIAASTVTMIFRFASFGCATRNGSITRARFSSSVESPHNRYSIEETPV